MLGDDPLTALTHLNSVRAPFYAEVADVIIDVDELSPAAVADRIIDSLDATTATATNAAATNAAATTTATSTPGKAR